MGLLSFYCIYNKSTLIFLFFYYIIKVGLLQSDGFL